MSHAIGFMSFQGSIYFAKSNPACRNLSRQETAKIKGLQDLEKELQIFGKRVFSHNVADWPVKELYSDSMWLKNFISYKSLYHNAVKELYSATNI